MLLGRTHLPLSLQPDVNPQRWPGGTLPVFGAAQGGLQALNVEATSLGCLRLGIATGTQPEKQRQAIRRWLENHPHSS